VAAALVVSVVVASAVAVPVAVGKAQYNLDPTIQYPNVSGRTIQFNTVASRPSGSTLHIT